MDGWFRIMCDCYKQKCYEIGCQKYLPMHISGNNTDRQTVRVLCKKHRPKQNDGRSWFLFANVKNIGSTIWKLGDWYISCDNSELMINKKIAPNCNEDYYDYKGEIKLK